MLDKIAFFADSLTVNPAMSASFDAIPEPPPESEVEWVVDQSRYDPDPDGSFDHPFITIAQALEQAELESEEHRKNEIERRLAQASREFDDVKMSWESYLDKQGLDHGLEPDFWMKTLHHCEYWSAEKENQHDNIWCVNPDETIAYMEGLPQPWIAFKILAAGAIHPEVGLKYAFEKGADFACVGMYDFQIVEDANLALDILDGKLDRDRPWLA